MTAMLHLRLCLLSAHLLFCVFASSFLTVDALVVGLGACRSDQIEALMEFKNEFDSRGCNHTHFVNGIRCNNATGAMKKLQLPSGCLRGTLKPNSSLFKLHHLRHLDLSENDFTSSSLPSELGNLNKLEVLYLYSNGFIGQVPSSFSNLSQLSLLDLSRNDLTGSFPLVHNLSKLYFLDLSKNHISGYIPSTLLTMPSLSRLELSENLLSGSIQVPNSSFSSSLYSMRLGFNQFDAKILEPISKLTFLEDLDLSSLNTSYPIDLGIFSSLKSLVILIFQDNPVLPASLSADSGLPLSLERLVLVFSGIREFPNILRSLRRLDYVYITDNNINGKVPEWFWKLPRLRIVNFSNNNLTGLEGSPEVLANSSVQFLDLASNSMTGAFPAPPLNTYFLSAWNNSFTGNIPLSICNLRSLITVDLSYNNFTGPIPPCLTSSRSIDLSELNLRKNNLNGSLPGMFYDAASLHVLDVGHNQLTGKLPRSLLNCSSLNFLSLDHNRFKDTFPFWLKTLPDLQALTLRSNKFYGPISPPDQGPLAFPELRILEISDNNFTGSLAPNYFVDWKTSSSQKEVPGKIYMGHYNKDDYGYNYEVTFDLQYKGISMEESNILASYSAIDFSRNRLQGQIPESIGHLKTLIALNLSNNAFTGHIPLSFANLTELESLDLSRNQLSGTIPNGIEGLSFLEYINVSHNQLKGEIPQGTQITGQPISSFEGNAGLCGFPLEQSCFGTNSPPIQDHKQEKEDEEVLNWKAVTIGYASGVLLGMALGKVFASHKPEWLVKIICSGRLRNR